MSALQYLKCPYCDGPMSCMSTMLYHIGKECQTEQHKAEQAEYDMGIIHERDRCKGAFKMIPVPKLIARIPDSEFN